MEIATVPVNFVRALLEAATRRGCAVEELLQQVNLSPELLTEDRARIPAQAYSELVDRITVVLQDEYCGLVAQPARPGTFAMICYGCIHCPNLGQFLERCLRFHSLTTECLSIDLIREGEKARVVYTPLAGTEDPHHLLTMSLLAVVHRLAGWLIGQNITLDSASLNHPRPDHAAAYNMLFRAPIHFDRDENSISFSANYLDMPVIQNEQALEEFLQMPGARMMASPDTRNSHVARVNKLIKANVAEEFPDFEWVAGQLHTTTGTLRRRLREEGTSYQQLKDDLRRDTAIFNLSKGAMSIEAVAASVGFSEPTSFFRAFKRWTGVTPRAYISREKVNAA
jgi:AraC-like DNA-binding protein